MIDIAVDFKAVQDWIKKVERATPRMLSAFGDAIIEDWSIEARRNIKGDGSLFGSKGRYAKERADSGWLTSRTGAYKKSLLKKNTNNIHEKAVTDGVLTVIFGTKQTSKKGFGYPSHLASRNPNWNPVFTGMLATQKKLPMIFKKIFDEGMA